MTATSAPRLSKPAATRVCFGGASVDVYLPEGTSFALEAAERAACVPPGGAPVLAHVDCRLSSCRMPGPGATPADIRTAHHYAVSADGERLRVHGQRVRGDVTRSEGDCFQARLQVGSGATGIGNGLRVAASVATEAAGGLSCHAAGSVFDGGVVLFIGVSGAGKTTAVEHVFEGACFAYDEVVLTPSGASTGAGFFAWRLPGGTPGKRPLSDAAVLPLLGILAIDKSSTTVRIATLPAAEAFFRLRAAIEVADASPAAEARRLATLERVLANVPVGRVCTVLGRAIDIPLRQWLSLPREGGA